MPHKQPVAALCSALRLASKHTPLLAAAAAAPLSFSLSVTAAEAEAEALSLCPKNACLSLHLHVGF